MIGIVSCSLYMTNGLVWLAFGAIWRFSKAGSAASGDKLERTYGTTDAQWDKQVANASEVNGY